MVHHIRRFVHGSGCVQIVLKELDSPVPGYQHTILNYSWCRICKQVGDDRLCLLTSSIRLRSIFELNFFWVNSQGNYFFFFFGGVCRRCFIVVSFCLLARWHQWCLYQTTPGRCPSPSTWSCASMAISTLEGQMRSPADTPSIRTTTSTSHTTRWWRHLGKRALSCLKKLEKSFARQNAIKSMN